MHPLKIETIFCIRKPAPEINYCVKAKKYFGGQSLPLAGGLLKSLQ
jgi:hypothetical protein